MGFLLKSDIDEICTRLSREVVMAFAGKRVLITGARGFLGRYLTEVLLELNATVLNNPVEVIALDNMLTAGELGADLPRDRHYAFVKHDIIKPFYPERPVDFLMHAAGVASPYYYRKWPLETLEVATIGLKNVLELARSHGSRVLFFSSSEIYGDPDPACVPTHESYRGNVSSLGPRSCYDESKRLGETMVYVYQQSFGVKGMITRPFNIYGPGMQKADYRVLPNFAAKLLAGEPLHVYLPGTQTRTFCYVTDAIVGFLSALVQGVPGEPYNIGNPSPEVTMRELARLVASAAGVPDGCELVAAPESYPADEPQRRCPDISKAIDHLGYAPIVGIEDGLKRFVDWAREAYR